MGKQIAIITIAVVIVAAACIGIAGYLMCDGSNKPLTATELLDIGEKYLLEMNY